MEPPVKKQRTTDEMLSETAFVSMHGAEGTFLVKCPVDSNDKWQLTGQTIEITAPYMSTVKAFKALVAEKTGLPAGSQKLKTDVFLKDAWTLAKHNVETGTTLELGVQKRGGR